MSSDFSNITIIPNQTIKINCETTGNAKTEIFWTHEQKIISNSSVLELNSSHEGIFTCIAKNSAGEDSKQIHVTNLKKPMLIKTFAGLNSQKAVYENESFELLCPFENFDDIAWFHNLELFKNGGPYLEQIENKLIITQVKRNLNGNISCVVENAVGNATFTYNINVLTKPKIIQKSQNPSFDFLLADTEVEDITVKMGETLNLSCEAEGNPEPKVSPII